MIPTMGTGELMTGSPQAPTTPRRLRTNPVVAIPEGGGSQAYPPGGEEAKASSPGARSRGGGGWR
jgi:hypothetical protein